MKLAFLAAAWLAGVLLGLRVSPSILPVVLLLLSVLSAGALLRGAHRSIWPAVLAGVFLLGLLRVEVGEGPPAPLAVREKEPVALLGRIADDREPTARRIKFVFEVDAVDRDGGMESVSAKALVYANPPESLVSQRDGGYFRYGDILRVEGELRLPRPFGDFDYPTYLGNQGISGILWARTVKPLPPRTGSPQSVLLSKVFDLRRVLSDRIERAMAVPHSATAQALLLGLRSSLSAEVKEDFRRTGTSHLLAISGLHVGVLLA